MATHLKMVGNFYGAHWERPEGFWTKESPATWLDNLLKKKNWKGWTVQMYNYQYSGHFADLTRKGQSVQIINLSY